MTLNDLEAVAVVLAARTRFESKVGPPTERGCRMWTARTDAYGYGTFSLRPVSKQAKAHRVAWVLANGTPIPDGLGILHDCDTPGCVEPSHLLAGTQAANMAACATRNRARGGSHERHHRAKLTEQQVMEIRERRASGSSCAALGREFGVGRDQVSRICTGKVWVPVGQSSINRWPKGRPKRKDEKYRSKLVIGG